MTNIPLVTIGMPVRNGGDTFERALRAVLTQDYPKLEIIISDNASTDVTAEIARTVTANDPRIQYYRHEKVLRAFQNFWYCVDQAQGHYFMWAAHDDLRTPNYVTTLVAAMADKQIVLAFPDLFVTHSFGSSGELVAYDFDNRKLPLIARLRKQALMQCFHIYGLWRTETLRNLLRRDLTWWPDLPVMMGAAALGTFAHSPGAGFIYLEILKTDAERAAYQDGVPDPGKIRNVAALVIATYKVLRPLVSRSQALLGALFVLEKNVRFGVGFFKRRITRL